MFSAATVAASLAAMLVFPIAFLRSFAYAGIAVVAMAALISVVVLPAALAVIGRRIDKWSVFRRQPKEVGEGFWHRLAMTVMRRPVLIGGSVVALLIVLGLPFLHVQLGLPDDRVLPTSASSRQVQDEIRTNFTSNEAGAVQVVAAGTGDPAARTAEIGAYAEDLSRLAGVARVDALTGSYIGGAQVAPPEPGLGPVRVGRRHLVVGRPVGGAALGRRARRLVHDVRALDAPFPVEVAGPSAALVDSKAAILGRLPLAAGIIAVITFVVLFLMFGSILVPLKAIVLNLLSLTATFGAMVWIFQDGHLAGPARLHPHRRHRHLHADPDVLHRLRAVDGLRGLPPVPDQGGARPHRRQPAGGRRGPGAHRPDRHRRRRPAGHRVHRHGRRRACRSSSCSASALRWPC